jgi:Skp family chaperone for outer membrane proteins
VKSHGMNSHSVNGLKSAATRGALLAVAALVLCSASMRAQSGDGQAQSGTAGAVRDLEQQVRELKDMVNQMRAENTQSRAEMQQLRRDLQETRAMLEGKPASTENAAAQPSQPAPVTAANAATIPAQSSASIEDRVQKLEDTTSLIGSKIDEQYQTKVETASKYRARLHGIVLMNAFRNLGGSDNLDFPNYAQPVPAGSPQATLGATLRQSEIGLELFGPNVAGAKTSADVQMDFAGGFPATGNGVNFGIVRLQTASVRLDWEHTSVVAGQDSLFISPLSPTSFASLATPAFALAGNLWGWTPQLRIEHHFAISDDQNVTVQAGVLDSLDWENNYNSFFRTTQAGEASGQPAYALRTAWSRRVHEHPLSFGVAGYYGRQNWDWNRNVDAWAGMADWQVPLFSRLGLSGEFYRGRGIGGLGGAIGTPILYGGNPAYNYAPIRGLDTAGGWTQLKFQVTPKVELNGVIAEDDAFAGDARGFATDANNGGPPGSIIGRNRGALGNVVFRPRSDLIFSAELRRLRTFPVYTTSSFTNQVNFAMGILF